MSLTPRLDRLDKNYIINGNFDFWQRGTANGAFGGTGASSGYAWADRVRYAASTTNNRSGRQVDRSTSVPTFAQSGFQSTYSLQYSQTSALVLAASDYLVFLQHRIEGIFYRELHGKSITLSFWFRSTVAGQYPVAFRNAALNRSYLTLFTYDTANVWQRCSVTLDTDTAGTWLFDNGIGLDIVFCGSSGTTYQAPSLNTWLSGEYFATASGVQIQAQTSITINVAQMKLEPTTNDSSVFSMSGRNWQEELQLCQRYYETGELIASPDATNASVMTFAIPYKSTKRVLASILTSSIFFHINGGGNATVTGTNPFTAGTVEGFSGGQLVSGATTGRFYRNTFFADAEL